MKDRHAPLTDRGPPARADLERNDVLWTGPAPFDDTHGIAMRREFAEQDSAVIHQSTADGRQCNFGEVFTTDGRIRSMDLAVMEDEERMTELNALVDVDCGFPEDAAARYLREEGFVE